MIFKSKKMFGPCLYLDCTCAGEKPPNFVDEDWNVTKAFVPRATNGQVFPWNNVRLPTFVKPVRYNITIHPNLTTLEVKGMQLHTKSYTSCILIICPNFHFQVKFP